ncbi:hypothetical protein [Sanguibacter antarcticus]|uniref:PknH-like protein n=1 Tax=Sanguibacter antarcticus TaxID=372484 RepID=A0A2A9E6V0_9MICO|nr:hypothetical protein [Sanguibacter antarcticus]PFG34574.1 hypothetical protein ATL42_2491 [Sanguibacter antarcticus]
MRISLRGSALVVVMLALAGCSSAPADEPEVTSTAPTAELTLEPMPDPSSVASSEVQFTTTLSPEAMLSGAAFGAEGVEPVVTESVDVWALPESCAADGPSTAVVSRGVTYGDGAFESTVETQQLAVFEDADAAVAEAQRLAEVMSACTPTDADGQTAYVAEKVAVGAQGTGLAVDYYGTSMTGSVDDALGYYVVTTRRGNAVTLVGHLGGEASIARSRGDAVASSQAAWGLLCVYDSAGC